MPNDEIFRRFLRFSGIAYALGAVAAAAQKKNVERSLSVIDRNNQAPEDFWRGLAAAYMSTIAAVAWLAGDDRRRAIEMSRPLLVAKGSTAAFFAYKFLRTRRPSYAVGAVTDGSILAATAILARRARRPRLYSIGGPGDVTVRADLN